MLSAAQFSMLSPVVKAAWGKHCARNNLDPAKKKKNGYREWYEKTLFDSAGVVSSKDIRGARQFGEALAGFAEIAGDSKLVRRLAEDDERRDRWVLRMLCVDLSIIKGFIVTWDYVRGIYGQSKLPPGDFSNCPTEYLRKVIAMLDIHVSRECQRLGFAKSALPRRATEAVRRNPHNQKPMAYMQRALEKLAAKHVTTTAKLIRWHNELERSANRDHAAKYPPLQTTTTDSTSVNFSQP